jgi:hypothetical protein
MDFFVVTYAITVAANIFVILLLSVNNLWYVPDCILSSISYDIYHGLLVFQGP